MRLLIFSCLLISAVCSGCAHSSAPSPLAAWNDPYAACLDDGPCSSGPPIYDQRYPHRNRDLRRWYRQLNREQRHMESDSGYGMSMGGCQCGQCNCGMNNMDQYAYGDSGMCENGMCMADGMGMDQHSGMMQQSCPTCQQNFPMQGIPMHGMQEVQSSPLQPTPAPMQVPTTVQPVPGIQPQPVPPATTYAPPQEYFPPAAWQPTVHPSGPSELPMEYPVQSYSPPLQQTLYAP